MLYCVRQQCRGHSATCLLSRFGGSYEHFFAWSGRTVSKKGGMLRALSIRLQPSPQVAPKNSVTPGSYRHLLCTVLRQLSERDSYQAQINPTSSDQSSTNLARVRYLVRLQHHFPHGRFPANTTEGTGLRAVPISVLGSLGPTRSGVVSGGLPLRSVGPSTSSGFATCLYARKRLEWRTR